MPAFRRSTRTRLRRRRVIRKRTFRRRTIRYRRRVKRASNRRILNVASKKKTDVRLPYTTLPLGTGTPVKNANGSVVLNGNIDYLCAYIVTAQDRSPSTQIHEIPNYRTSQYCYMKGYKENIRFIINNGASWLWRRVCFTYHSSYITDWPTPVNDNERFDWETSPDGWNRVWNNQQPHLTGGRLRTEMFKGDQGVDWIDIFTAPLDTDHIDVKSDVTRVLRNTGGNADVRIHNFKLWHPMNKTIIYDDDESGQNTSSSRYSSNTRKSMGDYFIVDIFQCAQSSATNTCTLYPTGRLYWHEK